VNCGGDKTRDWPVNLTSFEMHMWRVWPCHNALHEQRERSGGVRADTAGMGPGVEGVRVSVSQSLLSWRVLPDRAAAPIGVTRSTSCSSGG